jgi:hypothetical protein
MIGRDDVCLCLRVDPEHDGPTTQAALALQRAYARRFADEPLNVLLVVRSPVTPPTSRAWDAPSRARCSLPSSSSVERAGFLDTLRASRCEGGLQLEARLARPRAAVS